MSATIPDKDFWEEIFFLKEQIPLPQKSLDILFQPKQYKF